MANFEYTGVTAGIRDAEWEAWLEDISSTTAGVTFFTLRTRFFVVFAAAFFVVLAAEVLAAVVLAAEVFFVCRFVVFTTWLSVSLIILTTNNISLNSFRKKKIK